MRFLYFGLCLCLISAGGAAAQVPCPQFTPEPVAAPAPRENGFARERFERINAAVRTQPHRILFLGDSLTERFPQDAPQTWREHMVPRGILNAGVNGDRTEHLLWRLQHGHLNGPAPAAAIVLIGTNDLTNGGNPRPPKLIAEGIRANLLYLRQRLPQTRLLLLGLLPRSVSPDAKLRRGTLAVNEHIKSCGDGQTVVYADIGGVLLDAAGHLTPAIAPDALHFSELGYSRLVQKLDPLIDSVAPR